MHRLTAALCLAAASATAQEAIPCDARASAQAIPEPWEAHTLTFANGDIRLAVIDTIEPAHGWAWLLVLSPPLDELGARQCRLVGLDAQTGFDGIRLEETQAYYEPTLGLRLMMPVLHPADGDLRPLQVIVNQQTGEIGAGWFE